MAVLGGVAGRWRSVGAQLDVPSIEMDLIRSECTSDSECLRKALRYWIQRDPLASWREFIFCLDWSGDVYLRRVTDGVRSLAEELTGQCYNAVPQVHMIHLLFMGLVYFLVRQINFPMHHPPSLV